jgi:hypothetical protein
MTDRVRGKDGKKYLVSTMRYRQTKYGEIWETAIFSGGGFFTSERTQRYSMWMFGPSSAQAAHADAVSKVKADQPQTWIMESAFIEKVRDSATVTFEISNSRARLKEEFPEEFKEEFPEG